MDISREGIDCKMSNLAIRNEVRREAQNIEMVMRPSTTKVMDLDLSSDAEAARFAERFTERFSPIICKTDRVFLPIAALGLQKDGATVWVRGQITQVMNTKRYVYSSCNICKNGTEIPIGEKFSCFQTEAPHIGISVCSCKLEIRFEDESCAIKLTISHELAEKLLKRTAAQISCLSQEERLSFVNDVVDDISDRLFIMKLLVIQLGSSKKQFAFSVQHVEEVG